VPVDNGVCIEEVVRPSLLESYEVAVINAFEVCVVESQFVTPRNSTRVLRSDEAIQ
jgi:hypothetical protein